MAKDAAGHDRMRISKGWISVDPNDMSITISDGDGYTVPQTIICDTLGDLDLVIEYIQSGENPRPEPMGREHTKDDGWTYITRIDGTSNDFRYRPMGVRIQAEVVDPHDPDEWLSFGVFKDKDYMYGEIELSRADLNRWSGRR